MEICHLCLLLIHISVTKAYENEMLEYKGWRPLTREEAYKGLLTAPKLNFIQNIPIAEEYPEYSAGNHQEFRNEVIKLVEPQEVFREFVIKREELSHPQENKHTNEFSVKQNPCGIDLENCAKIKKGNDNITKSVVDSENHGAIDVYENQMARRAKILEGDYTSKVNKLKPDNKSIIINKNSDKTFSKEAIEEGSKTYYEVTENSDSTDFINAEQVMKEENTGYVYNEPKTKLSMENPSITNIFSNILTKYNIKNNDKLENYELSRVPYTRIRLNKDFIYLPIPIDNVRRYNSLNHLPVNPVLAVLLSNYGYYLPGLYGLHNNYRNLYGYLASNNIHNNGPFGTYKIFSDTDSSNK